MEGIVQLESLYPRESRIAPALPEELPPVLQVGRKELGHQPSRRTRPEQEGDRHYCGPLTYQVTPDALIYGSAFFILSHAHHCMRGIIPCQHLKCLLNIPGIVDASIMPTVIAIDRERGYPGEIEIPKISGR